MKPFLLLRVEGAIYFQPALPLKTIFLVNFFAATEQIMGIRFYRVLSLCQRKKLILADRLSLFLLEMGLGRVLGVGSPAR